MTFFFTKIQNNDQNNDLLWGFLFVTKKLVIIDTWCETSLLGSGHMSQYVLETRTKYKDQFITHSTDHIVQF